MGNGDDEGLSQDQRVGEVNSAVFCFQSCLCRTISENASYPIYSNPSSTTIPNKPILSPSA